MKFQIAILAILALMWPGCGTENKSALDGLKVEFHTVRAGIPTDHIFVYDPVTGEISNEKGNYWDSTDYPCYPTPYTPEDYVFDSLSVYPYSNSTLQGMLERGGWDPGSGDKRPICYPIACNKEKGLIVSYCSYYRQVSETRYKHSIQALGIIDIAGDSMILVDTGQHAYYGGYDYGMYDALLDQNGDYLYYRRDSLALRFDVQEGTTDTLPHGVASVVPNNSSDIIVWSYMYTELRLLNEDMSIKSWVRTDFTSAITCYSLGNDAFLIGTRDQWRMDVALYDFKTGTKTDLFESNAGEILGVRRD